MISGYGANPIFFNEKIKDWTSRKSPTSHPAISDIISFLPLPNPPQSGRHMCITPYADDTTSYVKFYISISRYEEKPLLIHNAYIGSSFSKELGIIKIVSLHSFIFPNLKKLSALDSTEVYG